MMLKVSMNNFYNSYVIFYLIIILFTYFNVEWVKRFLLSINI